MRSIRFGSFLMMLALFAGTAAHAADIDLFTGGTPTGSNAPQVLFVIDTGASFGASNNDFRCNISSNGTVLTNGSGLAADFTKLDKSNGGVEQCALYKTIQALETATAKVQVGVMFFNAGMTTFNPDTNAFGSACAGQTGGCLAMRMTLIDSATGPRIREWIRRWETSGNSNYLIKAPAARGDGATMQEAWAYLFGKTGISGTDYSAIAPAVACGGKHIIFLGNNWSQQASPKDQTNDAGSPLKRLNGSLSVPAAQRANPAATTEAASISYGPVTNVCGTGSLDTSEGKGAYALNWALYLRNQGVTTWSIALMNSGCDVQYGVFLQGIASAKAGGGQFFGANNYDALVKALVNTLTNISAVNSVFAAVSLPVSVNTQGSYLNQVYVGMFRPATSFKPRWNGNLKQYKIGRDPRDANILRLQDADGESAINNVTGFLTECARSFWTPITTDTYWTADAMGGCLLKDGMASAAAGKNSNFPDGNIVEKGAQAYQLRRLTPANRTVKTCSPVFASCTSLTDFSTSNASITQALLNNGGTDRDSLINWARGANLDGADQEKAQPTVSSTTMRPSAHGDIVHSRPVPVNYGTNEAPSIVIFYGGNDGLFRAVNGNRGSATDASVGRIGSFDAGDELWAFMPPEFYGSIKSLRANDTVIAAPAMPANAASQKRYGIDGPITAFQGTIGGAAKTYVYGTMRRGGRAVYAFDVTTPASPTLLWKKGCPNASDNTGCSTGYSGIGQTWSSLKSIYAAGYGSGTSPLLITGGGYDPCEDYDALTAGGANHSCGASPMGNRVLVIDAQNGDVVKAFEHTGMRSVVADSTVVRDSNGMITYAYTADLGGNVYRMTFAGAPADWTIKRIASLGCNSVAACTANRKFMFAPSVTTVEGVFYIMLGSGDREKPVEFYASSKAVTNYFFMIKDKPTADAADAWTTDTANCTSGTALCLNSLLPILTTATPTELQLAGKKGWYLGLRSTEQVVTSAVTVFGVVSFSTHEPALMSAANACSPNLGETRVYNIGYLNAKSANGDNAPRFEDVAGDGLPPSPVAGQVTLDDGTTVPFCIGCNKDSPLEGGPPKTIMTVNQPKSRLYWFIQK